MISHVCSFALRILQTSKVFLKASIRTHEDIYCKFPKFALGVKWFLGFLSVFFYSTFVNLQIQHFTVFSISFHTAFVTLDSTVACWSALLPHSKMVLGSVPSWKRTLSSTCLRGFPPTIETRMLGTLGQAVPMWRRAQTDPPLTVSWHKPLYNDSNAASPLVFHNLFSCLLCSM